MRKILIIIIFIYCGSATADASPRLRAGQSLWVNRSVQVCARPLVASPLAECQFIRQGNRLIIREVLTGHDYPHPPFYHVDIAGGISGYVMESKLLAGATTTDPAKAAADCRSRGDPQIGMGYAELIQTCWGKPLHVNRTETAGGVSDQYVYSGGRYVYIRNGVVTAIQATGRLR